MSNVLTQSSPNQRHRRPGAKPSPRSNAAPRAPRYADWLIPALLILLSLVPAIAGSLRLGEVARGAPMTPENERFVTTPLPVLLHILSVIPYSLLGALQFSPGLRRSYRGWHRAVGKALTALGFVVAGSGVWMTLTYPWANNDGELVYAFRLMVGSWMSLSLVLAVLAIRSRDFASHGAWMTRAYAIALGAGTQVFTHIPWFILVDHKPGESARALMMGSAWVVNGLGAEWIIRRRNVRS